jgi:hypothetical protein
MLLVVFFTAGALISVVVTLALVFPGTDLESIWRLKPEARTQFQTIGRGASAALMAIVATGCGFAAVGLARNREWGRRLAIGILIINLIGDSLNALSHARRKDFDRFANWWTNDSFPRQDKAIGATKPWWLQIYLTGALQMHHYFDLGGLWKHVERRNRIDGQFFLQFL